MNEQERNRVEYLRACARFHTPFGQFCASLGINQEDCEADWLACDELWAERNP